MLMSYIDKKEYRRIIKDILRNENFKKLYNIEHHGISRWEHLNKVAYYSFCVSKKLNMDYKSATRGALLHDFYLDGDERNSKRKFLDTFTHPKKALNTSMDNFSLNDMEKNIIVSHMFPIYLALPKYKESVIVNLVDKFIGAKEMLREYRYTIKYQFNYLFVLICLLIVNNQFS